MNQGQIIKAYKTIQKFEEKDLPLDISRAFFKLKKTLSDDWEFQIQKEKNIYEKYSPQQTENGLQFASEEDKLNWIKEMKELADMEAEWDHDKIEINIGDRMEMSISDLESLDDFMVIK